MEEEFNLYIFVTFPENTTLGEFADMVIDITGKYPEIVKFTGKSSCLKLTPDAALFLSLQTGCVLRCEERNWKL
jgi:hypothetical protein